MTIGSIPAGAVLSDGRQSFTATKELDSVDISNWNAASLKITPPDGFIGQIQLTVTATVTEASNSDHASTTSNLLVTVDPEVGQTVALSASSSLVNSTVQGLSGEYYGYNDWSNTTAPKTEIAGTNNLFYSHKMVWLRIKT